ncbi:hypothetical protein IQ254_18680 [Nodosilinea sp. LEGE 07088]|uniref:hypothetical protein n=1 Tax=Nodosilinea sp. LEGE 07088 TaxID=2777968 RepID=UPI0018819C61|nr:hypothetical protein [Nodosilinea sp. LEGE 07088]MBE9139196.1 hypothetical protein [Nodosilinea sp. LEGE 07088]
MVPEDNQPQRRTVTDIAYQFLLGIAFGLVLASLPALCISVSVLEWRTTYVTILGTIVMLCGILSASLGNRFLKPLITFLESIPPVV